MPQLDACLTIALLLFPHQLPPPCPLQWFNEEAAVHARMAELGRIIQGANYPTFITLQV
jgi:hypothetical protein